MKRALFRTFGGKYHQAKGIIQLMPAHRCYVEPFGGAASVLMRKPVAQVEVLGDADLDVVSLYRSVQDPAKLFMLTNKMAWTPFSSAEYERACRETGGNELERAWRLVVRSAMSHSPERTTVNASGFRRWSSGRRSCPASQDWDTYADGLAVFHRRLRRVVIEHGDACKLMRDHDSADTLHYVDPPYMPETRDKRHGYVVDLDRAGQVRLLECLGGLCGMVILSGYDSDLYRDALRGWQVVRKTVKDTARNTREECLWLNPSAVEAKPAPVPAKKTASVVPDLFGPLENQTA